MTDLNSGLASLFAQLSKLVKGLDPDLMDQLLSGQAKIAILPPGHRLVEPLTGLDASLRVLRRLTPEQVDQVHAGTAKVVLLPAGYKVIAPLDLQAVAEQIRQLDSQDEIVRALDSDSRLTGPQLKKLASEMNVDLPASARTKSAIQLRIAQTIHSYRMRSPAGMQ